MNTNTNNIYRDVTMDNISEKNVGETVRIAGWIENIRDHGGVSQRYVWSYASCNA